MSISPANWALLGDGSRWLQDFTEATGLRTIYTPPDIGQVNGVVYSLGTIKMYQRPFSMWSALNEPGIGDRYNTGYFAWRRVTSPSADTDLFQVLHGAGGKGGSVNPRPQWKQLASYSGAAVPEIIATDIKSSDPWLNYHTGFVNNVGTVRQTYEGAACDAFIVTSSPKELTAYSHGLWHYNPWAWFGTVPQVIADIAMKCGVPRSMIAEGGFNTAHDAYDLTTGDAPWKAVAGGGVMATKYEIAAPRIIGETCIEMLVRCASHSRDFYFTNERGQLACTSFTRGGNYSLSGPVGLTVGTIEWADTDKHMWNVVEGSWGSGALTKGLFTVDQFYVPPDTISYSVSDEDRCESYIGDKLSVSYRDTDSVLKYGERPLRGRRVKRIALGRETEVEVAHYQYLLRPHTQTANALVAFQAWMTSDREPCREVKITQDMRALDWGIGTIISNLAITPDGVTIPRVLCSEREYDFNNLTVTSVLLQIPSL